VPPGGSTTSVTGTTFHRKDQSSLSKMNSAKEMTIQPVVSNNVQNSSAGGSMTTKSTSNHEAGGETNTITKQTVISHLAPPGTAGGANSGYGHPNNQIIIHVCDETKKRN
jgi:hypothetical protein